MRLSIDEVRAFYNKVTPEFPRWVRAGRKHYRIELWNGRFLKLNRFENRIQPYELRRYLIRYAPKHAYMSVLDWLFPERVGGRGKANSALPLDGVFLLDLDVRTERFHHHVMNRHGVCEGCLRLAKHNALKACEVVEENYLQYLVVFSGRRGFHILIPFRAQDWTHLRLNDPLRTQAAARFKYAFYLKHRGLWFDFKTCVDPLRVHSVPRTLNGDTGLIVAPVGRRADLEALTVSRILEEANPTRYIRVPEYTPLMVTLRSARS